MLAEALQVTQVMEIEREGWWKKGFVGGTEWIAGSHNDVFWAGLSVIMTKVGRWLARVPRSPKSWKSKGWWDKVGGRNGVEWKGKVCLRMDGFLVNKEFTLPSCRRVVGLRHATGRSVHAPSHSRPRSQLPRERNK